MIPNTSEHPGKAAIYPKLSGFSEHCEIFARYGIFLTYSDLILTIGEMSLAFCYIVLTKSMNKQNHTKLRTLFHSQNGLALLSASFIAGLSIGLENTSIAIHQVTKKRSVLAVKEICLEIYILSRKP